MMNEGKKRFPREVAVGAAREICARLKPVTQRLIVAGSLRRREALVGDVEILYVPMTERRQFDLFSERDFDLAHEEIQEMLADGTVEKRGNILGTHTWGTKNKLARHGSGVPVDFFQATEANWWNYLVCRTGPAKGNMRLAEAAKAKGFKWNPYGEGFTDLKSGRVIAMESEKAVFEFVGLPYFEPWERR
jgi:DNA polymerase/3'-5' exonuclease PolX